VEFESHVDATLQTLSTAEAPLPLLERPDGPQRVQLAERGPVDVGEVELAVAALPGQKAAESYPLVRTIRSGSE
jgi:hypothetical protein